MSYVVISGSAAPSAHSGHAACFLQSRPQENEEPRWSSTQPDHPSRRESPMNAFFSLSTSRPSALVARQNLPQRQTEQPSKRTASVSEGLTRRFLTALVRSLGTWSA